MVAKTRGERKHAKANDTLGLLDAIQEVKEAILHVTLIHKGCCTACCWAYPRQQASAVKFGSVDIFDTTFNTNERVLRAHVCRRCCTARNMLSNS